MNSFFSVCSILLLFGSCGLDSIPLLSPPIDGSSGKGPQLIHNSANDANSSFKGYRIYYKIYENLILDTKMVTDQGIITGSTLPSTQVLTSKGYREILAGILIDPAPADTTTTDTKYEKQFPPHIKNFSGGGNFLFKLLERQIWDSSSERTSKELIAAIDDQDTPYVESKNEIIFRRNLSDIATGGPEKGGFGWKFEGDPNYNTGQVDTTGITLSNAGGVGIFIAVISEGRDTQGRQFFSTPVLLQDYITQP